jgi:hypothetical protein
MEQNPEESRLDYDRGTKLISALRDRQRAGFGHSHINLTLGVLLPGGKAVVM